MSCTEYRKGASLSVFADRRNLEVTAFFSPTGNNGLEALGRRSVKRGLALDWLRMTGDESTPGHVNRIEPTTAKAGEHSLTMVL